MFDDDNANVIDVEGKSFYLNLPEGNTEESVIEQLKNKLDIKDDNEYNIMYVDDDDFDEWIALVPFDITKIKKGSKLTLTLAKK